MNALIFSLILKYSAIYGIDPRLVATVIETESNWKINVVSQTQDYGLMQLNCNYYKQYTKKQLLDPETNIKLGIAHLAQVKKECKHKDNNGFLTCYNLGVTGGNKVRYPQLWPYTKKINRTYGSLK